MKWNEMIFIFASRFFKTLLHVFFVNDPIGRCFVSHYSEKKQLKQTQRSLSFLKSRHFFRQSCEDHARSLLRWSFEERTTQVRVERSSWCKYVSWTCSSTQNLRSSTTRLTKRSKQCKPQNWIEDEHVEDQSSVVIIRNTKKKSMWGEKTTSPIVQDYLQFGQVVGPEMCGKVTSIIPNSRFAKEQWNSYIVC